MSERLMERAGGRHAWPTVASAVCLARNLPIFVRRSPKTPLRALGVVAFDLLHVLRRGRPLPRQSARALAWWMDFQGCANAACDSKPYRESEHAELRAHLVSAGLGSFVDDYVETLQAIEARRPHVSVEGGRFEDARAYREEVARLAMAAPAALALEGRSIEAGLRATKYDPDVATLFQILMQCQIIDDVLDYRSDMAAGLPGFLTAGVPLADAIVLTREAAREYGRRSRDAVFPLRAALGIITAVTAVVMGVGSWRYRPFRVAQPRNAAL